jgi:peptidoglycan/LPS O-acetylase OafA/YrhL
VLVVSHAGAAWTSPLRWRFMQLSGALSYCIYLVHLSIGDGYEYLLARYGISADARFGPTGSVLVRAAVMIIASFAIAAVSRKYLEEPFLSLKDKLTRPTRAAVLPGTPEPTSA